MEASEPKKSSLVNLRPVDLGGTIAAAVNAEARKTSAKVFAIDARVSEQRAKQLRQSPADVRASTLIALAQKRPELRSLLIDLMTAEQGDGENPAVIMDRIARLLRP